MAAGLRVSLILCVVLLSACVAPAVQVVELALHGKSGLDLYRAIIANPQELLALTEQIHFHHQQRPAVSRYAGLNNRLATQQGWFEKGWLALDYIELAPESCNGWAQGCFAVELKRLSFSQCVALANHDEINTRYYQVLVNDERVSLGGMSHQVLEECKLSLPLLAGRNEIKYVSY